MKVSLVSKPRQTLLSLTWREIKLTPGVYREECHRGMTRLIVINPDLVVFVLDGTVEPALETAWSRASFVKTNEVFTLTVGEE